jgi:HD-GYP domain-containing protein (c-di-GMP phosphodiesterase class II)
MTADRPYRRALGAGAAREELRRGAGSQFDAPVVEAFLDAENAPAEGGAPVRVSAVTGSLGVT